MLTPKPSELATTLNASTKTATADVAEQNSPLAPSEGKPRRRRRGPGSATEDVSGGLSKQPKDDSNDALAVEDESVAEGPPEEPEDTADDEGARKQRRAEKRAQREVKRRPKEQDGDSTSDRTLMARGVEKTSEADDAEAISDDEQEQDILGDEEKLEQDEATETGAAQKRERPLPNPLKAVVAGGSVADGERLLAALRNAFHTTGIEIVSTAGDANLAVNLADDTSGVFVHGSILTVFGWETPAPRADESNPGERARDEFLPLAPWLRRYGLPPVSAGGGLTESGAALLGTVIRNGVLFAHGGTLSGALPQVPASRDVAEAIALSRRPGELLSTLSWTDNAPPKSLSVPFKSSSVEHFLDGNVGLSSKGEATVMPFYLPFEWHGPVEGQNNENIVYGLDFVTDALSYWNMRASGPPTAKFAAVEMAIKARGITASSLLTGAGAVILDCLRAGETLPPRAMRPRMLQRRARAFELFLLCCKQASARGVRFDEATCGEVFRSLILTLEQLRAVSFSSRGTSRGVTDAVMLTALSLPLRKTPYGEFLLRETLETLSTFQLAYGLTADGVWREGFAQHCAVFELTKTLAVDLRSVERRKAPLSDVNLKLARFVDVFLTPDGISPPIAEAPPGNYRRAAQGARGMLKAAARVSRTNAPASPISGPAGLFPEAGYFISRSEKVQGSPSSHLVLQARPGRAGGMSLSFSMGKGALLIGGGTKDRKAPTQARRAALVQPSAHNAIRINGLDYTQSDDPSGNSARIERAWEDKYWSAARLTDQSFQAAKIARTVIHLRPLHALLVVDELDSLGEQAAFEQFWQISPTLKPHERAPNPFCFVCEDGAAFSAAFDANAPAQFVPANEAGIAWTSLSKRQAVPNPYVVRSCAARHALLGGFFRWAITPVNASLQMGDISGGWRMSVTSGNSAIHVVFEGGQLRLAT